MSEPLWMKARLKAEAQLIDGKENMDWCFNSVGEEEAWKDGYCFAYHMIKNRNKRITKPNEQ